MALQRKSEKLIKIIGFILLLLSCLLWGLILIIPWSDFSKIQIAGITTGLIIAGEVLFYVSVIMIGKSYFNKVKDKLQFWKSKTKDTNLPR